MKRLISIVISVSLMFCVVGCRDGNDAIKGSLSASEEIETQKPASTSSKNDKNSANSSSYEVLINDMPEWSGKVFQYFNTTCDSLDLFVDWIKSGGTLEVDGKDYLYYGYADKFIEWVKDEDEILLPKSAHEDFKFSYVEVSPKSAGFTVGFFTEGENSKQFDVSVTGGLRKNLETLIGSQKDNYIKGMPHSRWGEYYYTDYYKVGFSSVRFFYEEYAITLTVYGTDKEKPWNPEYLDYFDFEKVTLK